MILTTTPTIEGRTIREYKGVVFGEVISGVNFLRDFAASIRNIVGGRSGSYEEELVSARTQAMNELADRAARLGADAVVGIDIDYEVLGENNGIRVGEGVVVVEEVEAAGGGDGFEPMVRKDAAEAAVRGRERVEEDIIGIVHPIGAEDRLQAAFVEPGVVRHERQTLDQRLNPLPYIREHRSILRVLGPEAVDSPAKPLIILRFRMDEAVECVHNLPVPDDDHPDAAHAGGLFVGCLEVYGRKVKHICKDTGVFPNKLYL